MYEVKQGYVNLLRVEQATDQQLLLIGKEIDEVEHLLKARDTLNKVLAKSDKYLSEKVNRTIHKHYRDLIQEQNELRIQCKALHDKTNSKNLRHVVHSLYTEKGLTVGEFASQIGYKEEDIENLTSKGIVSEQLLTVICTYFNIQKTKQFTTYL